MPMARGLERRGQSASTIANNYDISGGGMGRISVTMGGAHDLVQFSQVGRSPPAQSQPPVRQHVPDIDDVRPFLEDGPDPGACLIGAHLRDQVSKITFGPSTMLYPPSRRLVRFL